MSSELSTGRARRRVPGAYAGDQAESAQDQHGHAGVLPAPREKKR